MTAPTLDDPVVAAAYLRGLLATPVEAHRMAQQIDAMPEHDRVLVLVWLAARVPGTVSDAIHSLPCLAGCAHRRHEPDVCLAAYVDDTGVEATCECGHDPAAPEVLVLTPARAAAEAYAHDERCAYADDERADERAERAL